MGRKQLVTVRSQTTKHWVGNGFPVRNLFHYRDDPEYLSPFLLLDYVEPTEFPATTEMRGVGEHPHRGIETVTIAFAGEISHRDSQGGNDTIVEGGVQWMTAGKGVVHEEMHSENFRKQGGTLEMVQLWTNLPKIHKLTEPRYQAFKQQDFPKAALPGNAGHLTLIAGSWESLQGPARTFTPMDVGTLSLSAGGSAVLKLKEGYSALLLIRRGVIEIDKKPVASPGLAVCSLTGSDLHLASQKGGEAVFFSGAPIREPQVGHGPFVMNTLEEIKQAFSDYEKGLMGHLPT